VKLLGEEDPKATGSLAGKSIPVRLVTLGAGSLMNLLLPFILLSIALMLPHQAVASDIVKDKGELIVVEIAPDSPASKAGIKVNDTILGVNGEQTLNVGDYERLIGENLGKEITVAIKHSDATTAEVVLTPRIQSPEGEGATGVAITTVITRSYPFWQAIPLSAVRYWDILVLLKDGIVQSIKGTIPFDVTGPVGIYQTVGEVARTGISNLLVLTSLISINLGIVNIFPIPALDGGRIVFVLLEWVRRGKRVSPKTEQLVHTIGFFLLLALILLVTYRDIARIISGGNIMP
jgi:regulator of sigma E protease